MEKLQERYGCGDEVALRQKAWLQRDAETAKEADWRPLRCHRVAAKHWLVRVDNTFRHGHHWGGLKMLIFNHDDPAWQNWRNWREATFIIDCGSDGMAATHALEYGYDACSSHFPDQPHNQKTGWIEGMKAAGIYNFFLLHLIPLNYEFGPWNDETRKIEQGAAMDVCYSGQPHATPLFMENAPKMVEELELGGIIEFPREDDVEVELWQFLKHRKRQPASQRKVSLCRYGAGHAATRKNLPWTHVQVFERTYLALETDVLHGASFTSKMMLRLHSHDVGDGSTSSRRLSLDDKALRNCCANATAVCVLAQDDAIHQRILKVVVAGGDPGEVYLTSVMKMMQNVYDTERLLISLVNGGYMQHCSEYVGNLTNRGILSKAGFHLPDATDGFGASLKRIHNLELEIMIDDEISGIFGALSFGLLAAGLKRNYFLVRGWPFSMTGALQDDVAPKHIARFNNDKRLFKRLLAMEGLKAEEKRILDRHPMNMRVNKRIDVALEETGGASTPDFRCMLSERARMLGSTYLIEEFNGLGKNNSQLKACRRYRKPATLMGACLEAKVISEKHAYKDVEVDASTTRFDDKLPAECWEAKPADCTIDFSKVAGPEASPPWYSPSATNWTVPSADLDMLDVADAEGLWENIGDAWLGQWAMLKHKVVLAFPRDDGARVDYFVALLHFHKSAVLMWPCVIKKAAASSIRYVVPAENVQKPVAKGILTLAESYVQTAGYVWRSWLWQCFHMPREALTLVPGCRMVLEDTGFESFAYVLSRHAGWDMSLTTLKPFCGRIGFVIEKGWDLFDLLWHLIKFVLCTTDAETLKLIELRLGNYYGQEKVLETLLEIDDATQLLDKFDVQEIQSQQKSAKDRQTEHNAFAKKYFEKARETRESSRGGRGGGGGGSSRDRIPIPHHCSQTAAKKLIPPGASIWRDRVRNAWAAHLPPNPRISESFNLNGGSDGALTALLRRLWSEHLTRFGLDNDSCVVMGLF